MPRAQADAGKLSMTIASVAPDNTVWPPWARSRSRPVRLVQSRELQVQGTRHRITGTIERDHEAVAFALVDGRTPL